MRENYVQNYIPELGLGKSIEIGFSCLAIQIVAVTNSYGLL